jgi:hypothetical protein
LHPRAVVSKRRVLAPTCCCIKEKSPCTLYQREESLHPRAVVSKRRVLAPCIKEKSHCTHAISMFSGSTFCPQANVLAGLDRQRVASVALAPLQLSPQKERRVRGVGDVDGCHGWRRYATRHCVAQLCACVCVRVCVVAVVGGGEAVSFVRACLPSIINIARCCCTPQVLSRAQNLKSPAVTHPEAKRQPYQGDTAACATEACCRPADRGLPCCPPRSTGAPQPS